MDLYHRRFMANFVVKMMNHSRDLVRTTDAAYANIPKYSMSEYFNDIQDDSFRKKFLVPFQDEFIIFQERHAGKVYSNAMYGEKLTINLSSKILF